MHPRWCPVILQNYLVVTVENALLRHCNVACLNRLVVLQCSKASFNAFCKINTTTFSLVQIKYQTRNGRTRLQRYQFVWHYEFSFSEFTYLQLPKSGFSQLVLINKSNQFIKTHQSHSRLKIRQNYPFITGRVIRKMYDLDGRPNPYLDKLNMTQFFIDTAPNIKVPTIVSLESRRVSTNLY